MKTIAVVGVGIMGYGIALNYLKHGYRVIVWNRSQDKEKVQQLLANGAVIAKTPAEATRMADIIFEVTANDASSKAVWFGPDGIIAGGDSGADKAFIASGTFSLNWIDQLAADAVHRGLTFFDMPLTGGRMGAESGKLTLLAGGEESKFKTLQADLAPISEKQLYFGPVGSGMKYKLLLNTLQAIHIVGLGEVLKAAEKLGMDMQKVGNALAERPGGVITNLAWSGYQHEPNPINFSVEWISKDLTYAEKLIRENAEGLDPQMLNVTLAKFKQAIKTGWDQKDWTSVTKLN